MTQPNYQAVCLAAKSKGVDAMVVIQNAETVVRVADQCAQQGYKPLQLNLSGTVGQQWTKSANMEGALATQSNPVLADESIPATKTFHEALETYGEDVPSNDSYGEMTIGAWAARRGRSRWRPSARSSGPNGTPEQVKKGLYTFKDETVGGLTPPLTYTKGKPAFTTCWFVQKLTDRSSATQGAKPSCIAKDKLPALLKVLGA